MGDRFESIRWSPTESRFLGWQSRSRLLRLVEMVPQDAARAAKRNGRTGSGSRKEMRRGFVAWGAGTDDRARHGTEHSHGQTALPAWSSDGIRDRPETVAGQRARRGGDGDSPNSTVAAGFLFRAFLGLAEKWGGKSPRCRSAELNLIKAGFMRGPPNSAPCSPASKKNGSTQCLPARPRRPRWAARRIRLHRD